MLARSITIAVEGELAIVDGVPEEKIYIKITVTHSHKTGRAARRTNAMRRRGKRGKWSRTDVYFCVRSLI